MGCDIHGYMEVKIDGEWHLYNHERIDRNYTLFAKIAGVRNYEGWGIEPVAPRRGVPADISLITTLEYEFEGSDAHSMTWLSYAEILQVEEWARTQEFFRYTSYPLGRRPFLEEQSEGCCPASYQDIRFVCWFDN